MDTLEQACGLILSATNQQDILLRVIGGMAIHLHSPSASILPSLQRTYGDLDFVTSNQDSSRLRSFFESIHYSPNARFNALRGKTRMIFNSPDDTWHIDIFVDEFRMCHNIKFNRERLLKETYTIPLAELFLTKLQIVEINPKDVKDIAALLLEHPVSDEDHEAINAGWICEVCRADWGFYTSVMKNIIRIPELLSHFDLPDPQRRVVLERLETIRKRMEASPKTMNWKMRAAVGEKVKWYEEPEDAAREAIDMKLE